MAYLKPKVAWINPLMSNSLTPPAGLQLGFCSTETANQSVEQQKQDWIISVFIQSAQLPRLPVNLKKIYTPALSWI